MCAIQARLPAPAGRVYEGGRRLHTALRRSQPGQPLVSVVTVVRNRAATIEQCLRSVLAQSYDNIEYVVLDGASDDGTVAILERYANDIDYLVSEPDDGIYQAMNKALSVCHGDYVLLLNSDDWYRDDTVATLVRAALANDADVTHADAVTIGANGRVSGALEGPLHAGLHTSGMLVRHETMLVRRSVYDRYGGYDESYRIIADYLFTLRLYDAGCRFEYVPQRLLYFRDTGISYQQMEIRLAERRRLFASRFAFLSADDVDLLAGGRLANADMFALMARYPGASELFVRSLAFNIAASPSFRLAETLFEPLRDARAKRACGHGCVR